MPPALQQPWQSAMQQPTCTNVRIRSVEDCHKIFYAVRKGLLRMVTRRLDSDERAALRTGCVYAWEERSPNTEITGLGMERFTEGRRWSPSRVRDMFLFYYEKAGGREDSRGDLAGWEQLVKQTYSVWVVTDRGRRKWHLTAYFTQSTVDHLGTIDNMENVRNLTVPSGMFTSTRTGKRQNPAEGASHSAVTRVYAPFPSPLAPLAPRPEQSGSATSVAGRATSPSVRMYEPYSRPHSQMQQPELPPAYYPSGESRTYSPSPSTSQLPPLHYSYRSNISMSPPVPSPHSYTRQDDGNYQRPSSPIPEHPYASASTPYSEYTSSDRVRQRTPLASANPYQGHQHHQREPQQSSGGWYTSPMVSYPPPQGSPTSEYSSSSSSSSSSYGSSPTSYPPPPIHSYSLEPTMYAPPTSGHTRSLPRLSILDPYPDGLVSPTDIEERSAEFGPRRALPPLVMRPQKYPRDPTDDNALRRLPLPSP